MPTPPGSPNRPPPRPRPRRRPLRTPTTPAQRLVGGLNAAGITCISWERTEDPIGAVERGSCYVGGEEVVASIYESHADAAAEPENKAQLLADVSDTIMLVRGNWTLARDSTSLCTTVSQQFGGELVLIPA